MTHMASASSISEILSYESTGLQDAISYWLIYEKRWINLDKKSDIETNDVCCWEALGGGRWLYPADSIVFSENQPTGGGAKGIRWVWQENNAIDEHDSVITYIYTGSSWKEQYPRIRVGQGSPDDMNKTPNSDREEWIDATTGIIYHAHNGGWVLS